MKKMWSLSLIAITMLALAYAGEKSGWGKYKPFKGSYLIYSNDLGEEQPPTQNDRRISFMVTGLIAKDMFDSMSPDSKDSCSSDKNYRERNKDNVSCTQDRGEYACNFGFNLRTGKSIAGAIC